MVFSRKSYLNSSSTVVLSPFLGLIPPKIEQAHKCVPYALEMTEPPAGLGPYTAVQNASLIALSPVFIFPCPQGVIPTKNEMLRKSWCCP